ncbi:hypothetical protein ACQPW3_11560 [Actinosynnema sp. CA-248983]
MAPAVDLSILGLLIGRRHLALAGASPATLRPARRLLVFASVVTLALNVADPIVAGEYGKAAFDAVGPLLLIGWAEVGPDLLRALSLASQTAGATQNVELAQEPSADVPTVVALAPSGSAEVDVKPDNNPADKPRLPATRKIDDHLLERAREEDARHWKTHRRPVSADTLRKRLRIGAARSRLLVAMIRADGHARSAQAEVTVQAGV